LICLCSNGLTSKNLLTCISKNINDCKTAALVVTADNEYKENNYHVHRCIKELESLDLIVDVFDLDKQPSELLLTYDVTEFIGGNPFYLLHAIKKHNAINVLREIADNKVLIGWSAAAFVFSPSLELVNVYSPELNFIGLTDLKALALTKVEILPHYSRFINRFEFFEEKCCAYEEEHNAEVFRLNDGDGVFIDGEEILVCRA